MTGLDREPLRDATYVGELLAIPAKTVLQYARDGRLPCIRIGKHVRFRVSEVEAALDQQRSSHSADERVLQQATQRIAVTTTPRRSRRASSRASATGNAIARTGPAA